MMLRRKGHSVTHRSIPSCFRLISTETQQWSVPTGLPLMRISLFSCLQRASCISVFRTMRNTNLRGRQCCFRADPSFFNRANTRHLLSVCTVALMTHRILRHLGVVHSVWRTFAPSNAVAEDWHFTHVRCKVICLVNCGTGLRWTSRIQSTARKIGATLISRSRAFFNNGQWCGWNLRHPTGDVRHWESGIGKLVSSLPSLGCRNTSANLQKHIARARDLCGNFRKLIETWCSFGVL